MSSIFLSHNRSDKYFARELGKRLKSHGIRVWIDEAEIRIGDSLIEKISSAIKECTYLGVILSPNSVSSEWVRREVNIALTEEIQGKRVKVLPLLYKKSDIPGFLTDKLYADFTEDFEEAFKNLLRRLKEDNISSDKQCLLISDDTLFSHELSIMAVRAGFTLDVLSSDLEADEITTLTQRFIRNHNESYKLFILVRGEHFNTISGDSLYLNIQRAVFDGAALFATSWVAYMSQLHNGISQILPFMFAHQYCEDAIINCRLFEREVLGHVFPEKFRIRTSFEVLKSKEGSFVLLETDEDKSSGVIGNIPVFGYCYFGLGICYYLNTCQHSCLGSMPSPLATSPDLHYYLQKVFNWIYEHQNRPIENQTFPIWST